MRPSFNLCALGASAVDVFFVTITAEAQRTQRLRVGDGQIKTTN